MSNLTPDEKRIKQNWTRVLSRRMKDFEQSPAYQWLEDTKLYWLRYPIHRGYGLGRSFWSVESLAALVTGEQWVEGFGKASRLKLAAELIEHYKTLAGVTDG